MRPWCVLLVLMLGLAGVRGAEPAGKGRALTEEGSKAAAELVGALNRHWMAGEFEQAAEAAKEIADYRAQRQGENHWEVMDARLRIETWQRRTRVPAEHRADIVRALGAGSEGSQLGQRLRYRESEEKLREALEIRRQVLGERHPDTALS